MQVGDILLGRPWQFDRRVMYDGYLNMYSFVKDGRKITLGVPLSSANVFSNQLKLEEIKIEFEEKELKEKPELSDKIEKNQREKKKNEKRDGIEEKRKRELFGYRWRGEKVFTKINLCTYVQWRIFGV